MIPGWLAPVLLLLPLCAFAVTAPLPRSRPGLAHGLAVLLCGIATVLAAWQAIAVVGGGAAVQGPHLVWLELGRLQLGIGTFVDPMGAVMALIVCLLATVVLAFNAWYMHGDGLASRFPWQFCLFVAAMLGVVLSDNLFMTFVCWELVGLGSYLLIGFWFHKPAVQDDADYQRLKGVGARGILEHRLSPAHAQLKAFVMNRVGDALFLAGIGALLASGLAAAVHEPLTWANLQALSAGGDLPGEFLGASGGGLLTLAALLVFGGAVAKSAQFPLHPWLPDAMQGPTTASSIIHAATMVAAGVFLVARTGFLFTEDALTVVGWTGGLTCLLAATIACVQWDLKAVLAWSTVSQLGLMFVGLGAGESAGGMAAGIAHLFTHALFKCLLFLCAGAVIHAAAGCQDLHRMGGLWRRMPVTAAASGLAVLAIAGAPLFSGFYSKDAVLAAALAAAEARGGAGLGPLLLASCGSLLTCAYMLRWWLRVFAGEERQPGLFAHAHDPSGPAKWALLVLAPSTLSLPWTLGGWLDGALGKPGGEAAHATHAAATAIALTALVVGAGFASYVFLLAPRRGRDPAAALARRFRGLHAACAEAWGIERLYDRLFTRALGEDLGRECARADLGSAGRLQGLEDAAAPRLADFASIDGLVDGLGRACAGVGRAGSLLHGGRLGVYIVTTALVVTGTVLFVLLP